MYTTYIVQLELQSTFKKKGFKMNNRLHFIQNRTLKILNLQYSHSIESTFKKIEVYNKKTIIIESF
jgi:hypothetical protein